MRFLACTIVLAGCATDGATGDVADLHKRLDEALRRQAQAEKKLETLEDRVFLLTDQLESQKVAAAQKPAPRLPVVQLHPGEEEPPPAPIASEKIHDESGSWFDDGKRVLRVKVVSDEDPMKAYRAAYDQLRAGANDAAAKSFREFVRRWPRHDLADNAQYWLGECFYAQKRYAEAAPEFRAVVDRWPLANKAPDALLKLGFCLAAMGDEARARDVLSQVGQSYPRTDAARLAEVKLREGTQ
jgi:tol-pal system protein YbgF